MTTSEAVRTQKEELRRQADARRLDVSALESRLRKVRATLEAARESLARDLTNDPATDTDARVLPLLMLEARERVYALAVQQAGADGKG